MISLPNCGNGNPARNGQEVEPYIRKGEVARRLGIKPRTTDQWMKDGKLVYLKVGRSVRFKWSEVEAHLAQTCRVCRRGN